MNKTLLSGIVGGVIGAALATGIPAVAQMMLDGHRLTLRGSDGKAFLDAAKLSGPGSSLCFYGDKAGPPLCLGTYSENGLPFVALGENPRVQVLLRLAGRNESGVLVFKDKGNHDRMVLGLDMDGADEEPFLVTYDKSGKKTVRFGRN